MWRRRKRTEEPEAVRQARETAARATAERRAIERAWDDVKTVSRGINSALERNGFGESIELTFKRRGAT